jgi:hypothetical protein
MTTKLDEIKARWAPMAAGCVSRVERNEAESHAEHDVAWPVGEVERLTGRLKAMKAAGDGLAEQLTAKSNEAFEANAKALAEGVRADAAKRARDEWARQCNMASEAQANALNDATRQRARADAAETQLAAVRSSLETMVAIGAPDAFRAAQALGIYEKAAAEGGPAAGAKRIVEVVDHEWQTLIKVVLEDQVNP